MPDPTESIRRGLVAAVNSRARQRASLEKVYGQVWSTDQLRDDFDVLGFGAPFVVVVRKSDGQKGSLMFQHHPRLYFQFEAAE